MSVAIDVMAGVAIASSGPEGQQRAGGQFCGYPPTTPRHYGSCQ
jgi:hypothetical protein